MSAAVVRLPTAARRQVQQPQNKLARAAKAALRERQGRKFPYAHASMREAQAIAKAIHPMTPDRWLIVSILKVLDDDQRARLAPAAEHSPTVAGLFTLSRCNFELMHDVTVALREMGQ